MWQERTQQDVNRFIWSMNANWRPTTWLLQPPRRGQRLHGRTDDNLLLRGEGPPLSATTRLGSRGIGRVSIQNFTVDLGSTASYTLARLGRPEDHRGRAVHRLRSSPRPPAPTSWRRARRTCRRARSRSVSEGTNESRTFGAFVEQAIAFNDRLFLTAAVRSDQNSAFGTNFQSIVYPKASVSWIISDENFWRAPSFLNSVRLRYAYGQSGVQPGQLDGLRFFVSGTSSIDNADQPTITQSALGNPDLKPERSAEHEMGFEAQLLNKRLSLDLTYYSKITRTR